VIREVLLPWERLLWSSRPWRLSRRLSGERYLLTDFRLLHVTRGASSELALDDVGDIHRTETPLDRVLGTSTIAVHPIAGGSPLILTAVRRGPQLAALLELLAGDPRAPREVNEVRSALAWEPRPPSLDPSPTPPTMRWHPTARSAARKTSSASWKQT
jgi:hypothetical protein